MLRAHGTVGARPAATAASAKPMSACAICIVGKAINWLRPVFGFSAQPLSAATPVMQRTLSVMRIARGRAQRQSVIASTIVAMATILADPLHIHLLHCGVQRRKMGFPPMVNMG